jgi:hypothetical protein
MIEERMTQALRDESSPTLAPPPGPCRPWYRLAVLAYDRLYRACHRLDTPASQVGPALRIEVRPSRRTRVLPDGTRIRRGERVGVIHLNNARIAGMHTNGLAPLGVGLEFRRQLLASLQDLAGLAVPGGPLGDITAFVATTIFHRGLARLGFQPEGDGWLWPHLVAAYQRALLASLHPARTFRMRDATYRRARRVWIARDALVSRFARVAAASGDAASQVERISWRMKQA